MAVDKRTEDYPSEVNEPIFIQNVIYWIIRFIPNVWNIPNKNRFLALGSARLREPYSMVVCTMLRGCWWWRQIKILIFYPGRPQNLCIGLLLWIRSLSPRNILRCHYFLYCVHSIGERVKMRNSTIIYLRINYSLIFAFTVPVLKLKTFLFFALLKELIN